MRTVAWTSCLLTVLASASAQAQDLSELLAKGPVVSIETDAKGKFVAATAVILIDRPIGEVWAVSANLGDHKNYMPKLLKSEAKDAPADPARPGVKIVDLALEVETPGANPSYTFRYELDEAKKEITCAWKKGDLKGSKCSWRMVPLGESRTLLYHTAASRNFSALANAFEDDEQTLTMGVNVSSAVAVVKAVKKKAEAAAPPAAP